MRRTLVALASAALATLAFAGVAFASPTRPDLELTVTPDQPTTGTPVLLQAYVHFGTKPYQGAQVQFEINGPNIAKTMINAKPGEAGYYRAQFTPQGNGDFTVTTIVDNEIVSPKPYHFQVSGTACRRPPPQPAHFADGLSPHSRETSTGAVGGASAGPTVLFSTDDGGVSAGSEPGGSTDMAVVTERVADQRDTAPEFALIAKDVLKAFLSREKAVRAVDGISLAVRRGEIYGLLGANGSGKSTLLRLLAALLAADSGEISVFGRDLKAEEMAVKRLVNR